ncbi:hypothetical protein COV19_05500 [Candidatus Woesearchaeota archaeon CG10_big_fil_rev_8_21_14_0_10_44_13]|nr:MAG: hypothetical protein COV19_05500 [Candidatus Woesearchaeota archaeon CG10_big_fil_rev_8_21_14_0_10_44_13]
MNKKDNRKRKSVAIIILNWNGWKDTIECLESLFKIDYPDYDVVIVDNNSTNGSVDKIKGYLKGKTVVNSKYFSYDQSNKPLKYIEVDEEYIKPGKWGHKAVREGVCSLFNDIFDRKGNIIIIKNKHNYGFAEGNNVAIDLILRMGKHDYINLLNNDTIVEREYLKFLIECFEKNKRVGMTGPKIYFYDYEGKDAKNKDKEEGNDDIRIWFGGAKRDYIKGSFKQEGLCKEDSPESNIMKEVPFITGCCQLIKSEVFRKVGLYPADYYLYFDDVDFCQRVGGKFKMVYCPKSVIYHKVSSSIKSDRPKHIYYFNRARLIYLMKNFNLSNLIPLMFFAMSRSFLITYYLFTNKRDNLTALFRSFLIWKERVEY